MKIYATDIMWDVDDNLEGILPTEVEVPFDIIGNYGIESISDPIGFQCLIESESDLKDVPIYKIKEDYRVQDFMEQNDCETVSLQEITSLEEYFDLMNDLEFIYFNKSDIEDIEIEQDERDEI